MQRLIKCGVDAPIKLSHCFINDRPYFQRPVVLAVLRFLIACLKGEADANGPVPVGGYHGAGAYMAAYVSGPVVGAYGIKKIAAGFKPVVEAMSYFYGFMEQVVGGQYTILHLLLSAKGIVTVQFNHCSVFGDGLGFVNLYFVIILRENRAAKMDKEKTYKKPFH